MNIRFVQAIPFGKPLTAGTFKIDSTGKIWTKEQGKFWPFPDINSVIEVYKIIILFHRAPGIRLLIITTTKGTLRFRKDKESQEIAEKKLKQLQKEKERCEDILMFNIDIWLDIYGRLKKYPQETKKINWSDFFYGLRRIKTLKANPYKIIVSRKEIKKVEQVFYRIKKREIETAKNILGKAILELIISIKEGGDYGNSY